MTRSASWTHPGTNMELNGGVGMTTERLYRYLDKTRYGKTEFQKERLPGAVFFDIETIADKVSTLPHMLPKGSVLSV